VAMQQEKQRVLWRCRRRKDHSSEAGVREPVRVVLHIEAEGAVLSPESQRLCFGQKARRGSGLIEERPAVYSQQSIVCPKTKGIGRAELNRADRIGYSKKVECEDVWRG